MAMSMKSEKLVTQSKVPIPCPMIKYGTGFDHSAPGSAAYVFRYLAGDYWIEGQFKLGGHPQCCTGLVLHAPYWGATYLSPANRHHPRENFYSGAMDYNRQDSLDDLPRWPHVAPPKSQDEAMKLALWNLANGLMSAMWSTSRMWAVGLDRPNGRIIRLGKEYANLEKVCIMPLLGWGAPAGKQNAWAVATRSLKDPERNMPHKWDGLFAAYLQSVSPLTRGEIGDDGLYKAKFAPSWYSTKAHPGMNVFQCTSDNPDARDTYLVSCLFGTQHTTVNGGFHLPLAAPEYNPGKIDLKPFLTSLNRDGILSWFPRTSWGHY